MRVLISATYDKDGNRIATEYADIPVEKVAEKLLQGSLIIPEDKVEFEEISEMPS